MERLPDLLLPLENPEQGLEVPPTGDWLGANMQWEHGSWKAPVGLARPLSAVGCCL